MAEENILYLDVAEFEDGKMLRGGALVVDATTEPLEFRCTDAVRPTMLQRILWGARMDSHIAVNIVGLPLTKALSQKFAMVVVRDTAFLGLRQILDVPVIRLAAGSEIEFADTTEEPEGVKQQETEDTGGERPPEEVLHSASGRYEPVVLRTDASHADDRDTARQILAPIFRTRNVLEPFSRIASALEMVHREQSKG